MPALAALPPIVYSSSPRYAVTSPRLEFYNVTTSETLVGSSMLEGSFARTQTDIYAGKFLSDVFSLLDAAETEVPITEFAFGRALELTPAILPFISMSKQVPHIVDDDEGGIRVTWRFADRELRMSIASSPSARSYLYWDAGSSYDIEENFSTFTLTHRLDWLYKNDLV